MNHHLKVLELDKILEKLAAETAGEDAAAAARALRPAVHIDEVRRLLDETDDACRLMAQFGAPSFGQLRPVGDALSRAASGACLSPRELLEVAALLYTVRAVFDWRQHCDGVQTVLDDRFSALSPNKYLEQKIHAVLLSEETVADDASPTLRDIRRKMRAAAARVREKLREKGVPRELWEDALEQLPDPAEQIDRFLGAKLRGQVPDEKEKKRLSDALLRRGFAWSDVRAGMNRLGADIYED